MLKARAAQEGGAVRDLLKTTFAEVSVGLRGAWAGPKDQGLLSAKELWMDIYPPLEEAKCWACPAMAFATVDGVGAGGA
jgi:hypothetical protein